MAVDVVVTEPDSTRVLLSALALAVGVFGLGYIV